MIISERIFQMLKEKGISQKEFSGRTGIAQSTISDWKHKKTNPAADKLLAICEALDTTLYELLSDVQDSGTGTMDYVYVEKDSPEHLVLTKFQEMEEENRERLLKYMQELLKK